jgi:hypothetical protein
MTHRHCSNPEDSICRKGCAGNAPCAYVTSGFDEKRARAWFDAAAQQALARQDERIKTLEGLLRETRADVEMSVAGGHGSRELLKRIDAALANVPASARVERDPAACNRWPCVNSPIVNGRCHNGHVEESQERKQTHYCQTCLGNEYVFQNDKRMPCPDQFHARPGDAPKKRSQADEFFAKGAVPRWHPDPTRPKDKPYKLTDDEAARLYDKTLCQLTLMGGDVARIAQAALDAAAETVEPSKGRSP